MKSNASHSLKKRKGIFASALLMILALSLAGRKASPTGADDRGGRDELTTPRTSVPAELAGRWNSGNVSSINFYDASKGKWGSPSGTGFFFSFSADGYFEFGGILQQTMYGCTTDFFSYKRGTMMVERNTVTIYPHVAVLKKTDSCNPQNNYERQGSMEQEVFQYQIGTDAFGNVVMYRIWPDGQVSVYRRE